ncbi:MAG: hypothetical protein PHD48_09470 [Alphaproteobacteria bacterium]|nr:hypothetical protein [Alphaproteobacteria bacterium]
MKKRVAILILALISSPAFAGGRCYSAQELQAEQLLRLHSELMVITVTCKQSSTGRDLVRAYTGFTRRNIKQLKNAEQALIGFYEKFYGGNGVSRLDTLRTKLANEFGQESANVSAPTFCAQRRDKVIAMYDSPPKSLRVASMEAYKRALNYEPVCDKSLKVASADMAELPETPVKQPLGKTKKIKKGGKS